MQAFGLLSRASGLQANFDKCELYVEMLQSSEAVVSSLHKVCNIPIGPFL